MIRIFELIGNPFRGRGDIRRGHTTLLERVRSHRLVRPVNVRLRIILLGDETIHDAGALGLFGVKHGFHRDSSFALEVLQDRLRKNLVLAHVDHDSS